MINNMDEIDIHHPNEEMCFNFLQCNHCFFSFIFFVWDISNLAISPAQSYLYNVMVLILA